jgi:uncharacterized protein (DUF58 family)
VSFVDRGTVLGWHIGGIELVLDTHGDTMERPFRFRLIAPFRLRESQFGVKELPGTNDVLPAFDPIYARSDELLRRDLPGLDLPGRLGCRQLVKL